VGDLSLSFEPRHDLLDPFEIPASEIESMTVRVRIFINYTTKVSLRPSAVYKMPFIGGRQGVLMWFQAGTEE